MKSVIEIKRSIVRTTRGNICICLQEGLLENIRYNLGRECEFYATGQIIKGRTAIKIK